MRTRWGIAIAAAAVLLAGCASDGLTATEREACEMVLESADKYGEAITQATAGDLDADGLYAARDSHAAALGAAELWADGTELGAMIGEAFDLYLESWSDPDSRVPYYVVEGRIVDFCG